MPRTKKSQESPPAPKLIESDALPRQDESGAVFYERFRKRLRDLREDAGYTQAELADMIGISLASYKHIEGKRASPFPLHKLGAAPALFRQSAT